jgi:tetratricopeptide (TPR) repeat protein
MEVAAKADAAGPSDTVADCNSDDPKRRLTGCAELIKRGTLGDAEAAIVHSRLADAKLAVSAISDAISHLTKAHELQRNDGSIGARLAEVHKWQAGLLAEKGDTQEALVHYSEAITLVPTDHDARLRRSLLYAAREELDMAIEDMKITSSAAATSGVHRKALSRLHERRGIRSHLNGEYDRALADFDAALALDKSRDSILVNRATLHAEQGDCGPDKGDRTQSWECRCTSPSSRTPLC